MSSDPSHTSLALARSRRGLETVVWRLLSLALLGTAALSCSSTRTAVIVVIEADLVVPDEIASVRALVGEGPCGDTTCTHDFVTTESSHFPFSFVVEPRGNDTSAAFDVLVTGRDSLGAPVVARSVLTAFLPGRTLLLRVGLSRACRAVPCAPADTCVRGACVSRVIDPRTLPDVRPGQEFETLNDAGVRDAPMAADGASCSPADDSDADGICDGVDACPGFDDRQDEDGDGTPDGCDTWPCGRLPTVPSPVTSGEIDITSVSFAGGGRTVVAVGGATVPTTLGYSITDCGCPGCIDQIEVGLVPGSRFTCVWDAGPGCGPPWTGTSAPSFTAPMASGVYDVRFGLAQDFGCTVGGRTDWWRGPPGPENTIGVVCVR